MRIRKTILNKIYQNPWISEKIPWAFRTFVQIFVVIPEDNCYNNRKCQKIRQKYRKRAVRTSTHKSGKDKNMNQLEVLRESLGQCDEIILDALLMRNRIVEDIMVYKEANNVPILQPEQEAKQKEWLERRMQEKRHKNEVADVFESITRNSKKIQARKLFNYNIVLIGFMGAGKSTISDYLKTVFAMDIIEMDQIIAERAGMSISDIFETYGEQYFRDCETNLLIEMQSRTNVVISCGGGTPMRECNVVEMKKNGRVVLLTAKPETILDRVKDSHDRPLIENNKTVPFIADLMSKRREKYEAAADIIIETDGKSELEICEELIHSLRQMDAKAE